MDFRDIKEFTKDTLKYFVMVVAVLFTVLYVVSIQQVVGPSMSPNYQNGDVTILSKLHYHLFPVKRFDVVTIQQEEKYIIKRIIGLPGETVRYQDNQLYINGRPIEEPFLENVVTEDFDLSMIEEKTIGEDEYFVLGDNRGDSMDSRTFGLITKKDIIGKVAFRIWPIR